MTWASCLFFTESDTPYLNFFVQFGLVGIVLLLGIGVYLSLLIFYTFETLFVSGLVYILLIPVSYFNFKYKKKLFSAEKSNEQETEDIL